MAGYYNTPRFDLCNKDFDNFSNQSINDYNLNLAAHYRVGKPRPMPLSQGMQPSFWGPLRGVQITRDSFLQGRGQTLADCPDCDVRWLPESLFPAVGTANAASQCQRTDIQSMYTRQPKSCNGLASTDTSEYWMMPSNWKKGYVGYNAVVDTNMQTRMPLPPPGTEPQNGAESYGPCRQNYGTYGSGADFSRYGGNMQAAVMEYH